MYKLQDLIDREHFQNIQDRLNEIYSFPSAILDNEGNILSHLHEANPAVSYHCPRGLVENATPIIIEGIHYGNFFTGQFFMEKPDIEFFKAQAKKYEFNEAKYLDAVNKVPIWTHEKLNSYLFLIKGLITILSESGLKKLKEIETSKQIEESQELHQTILQTAIDGFWMVDMQRRLVDVNEAYCRMSGYSKQELLAMSIPDLESRLMVGIGWYL